MQALANSAKLESAGVLLGARRVAERPLEFSRGVAPVCLNAVTAFAIRKELRSFRPCSSVRLPRLISRWRAAAVLCSIVLVLTGTVLYLKQIPTGRDAWTVSGGGAVRER